MPRFSVLVPVYNGELHIKKCLESLLEQTFEDFEVILLNDGSSDRSGEIADEFALNDKRIHVFFSKESRHLQNQNIHDAAGSRRISRFLRCR